MIVSDGAYGILGFEGDTSDRLGIADSYAPHINANVWNKGKAHIAGNVNTAKIRRFPVVTEMCVQYVFEARLDNLTLLPANTSTKVICGISHHRKPSRKWQATPTSTATRQVAPTSPATAFAQ